MLRRAWQAPASSPTPFLTRTSTAWIGSETSSFSCTASNGHEGGFGDSALTPALLLEHAARGLGANPRLGGWLPRARLAISRIASDSTNVTRQALEYLVDA